MNVVTMSLVVLCQGLTVLLDFIVVLIVVRVVCSRWRTPWLSEFDEAGRPLVNRALMQTTRMWSRLAPNRPLAGAWRLRVCVVAIALLRVSLQLPLALIARSTS